MSVEKITARQYRYKLLVKKESSVKNKIVTWSFSGTDKKDGEREFEIPAGTGFYCLEGDIDVPQDAVQDRLDFSMGTDVVAGCVFPVHAGCSLYCYDSKGQVVCQVGSNGIVDYREYDRNGRLKRVFDKNGYLMDEYDYHVNSNH